MDGAPAPDPMAFLAGGGETGALMRRLPWTETEFGPPAAWPEALKTLAGVMLGSNQPMFVVWGPRRRLIYNDPYVALLRDRHPAAMGAPFEEVWREAWETVGPILGTALAGEPIHMDDLPLMLLRDGRLQEARFGVSYNPVRDETGTVRGVFCACNEITARVQDFRRSAVLARLSDRLRDQGPAPAILDAATEETGRALGAARCGYAVFDWGAERLVTLQEWTDGRLPRQTGAVALADLDHGVLTELRAGRIVAVEDVSSDPRLAGGPVRTALGPVRGGLGVPLLRGGALTAVLFVHDVVPRLWTDWERALLAEVADRIGTALAQRSAEVALRESEARFRALATAGANFTFTLSPDWSVMRALDGVSAFGGEARAGPDWLHAYVPPEDHRAVTAAIAEAIRTETPFSLEHRVRRQDGSIGWAHSRAIPIRDAEGRIVEWFGSAADITSRREAEVKLRDSDRMLRLAADAAEIGLWNVVEGTGELFWDARTRAMFGIGPDAPVSMDDFYAGLHPEDRARVIDAYAAAADPGRRALYDVEYRTIGRDDGGVVRWVAAKGRGVFDRQGRCLRVTGTAIDITEKRRAERRLAASEAALGETVSTLEALLANAPIGFAFLDREHRYVRINPALAAMNGVPATEHLGRRVEEVLPANAPSVVPTIDRVFAHRETVETEIDGETPARPGEPRSWLTSFFPVLDTHGHVILTGATVVDITERRRTEEAMRALNETLEARVAERTAERDRIWRNARDILLVLDEVGTIRATNPAFERVLGWPEEQVRGRSIFHFILREDHAATRQALPDLARGELPGFENRYRHRDGSWRILSWVSAPEGGLIYANGRDVTAERERESALAQAQEALRQSQKMEAIGQLTGGIAHDFNNLLQGMMGSFELIRRKTGETERVQRWAEAGLAAAERGARLTGQLLAFSRSQKLEVKPVALATLVSEMRELLERTLGPTIRITIDTEPISALGDEVQIEMALLNLAINARDAMPEGGALVIAARRVTGAVHPDLSPGAYVELSVADTGSGMPPEIAARAFEPFFTTKEVGRGSGLGLAQVYGSMRQAGGAVAIDTAQGQGTTVRLLLRATEDDAGTPIDGPAAAQPAGRRGTILVVEDDATIRHALTDMLDLLGYGAVTAASGVEGLATLREARPDAMIADFAMPGMNGADLAREARVVRPDLPVLFISGFSDTAAIEAAIGPEVPRLRKPFRASDLAAALETILE